MATDNKLVSDDTTVSRSDDFETGLVDIDPSKERKLVRKLDLHIIPPVMLLYTLSFLDRVNIGNARLYGLEADLGMNPLSGQFQTAVSILFVTYIISELPSNWIVKHYVSPSRWIAFITTAWGIIATLTGICQTYGGLIACRLFLGLVEGGLFPALTVYLTFFYTKRELALRIGYLFVSSAISGAFGGLLAFGIGYLDGRAGLRGWRWIMIIEGLPTFVLGIVTWFVLADDPETAYYLTPKDKQLIAARKASQLGVSDIFEWKDARKALKDWRIWVFCAGQFCVDTILYGYSTFLPTIIKAIRPQSTSAQVQLLTIPCYAVGAIAYMSAARFSDWKQTRGPIVCAFGVMSVIGYALLISDSSSNVHYAGCFFVALGLYVTVGIPYAWVPSNNPRYGKRTTAVGMVLTIGNTSGIMAPFLYPSSEGPRYVRGHAVTLALASFAILLYALLTWHYKQENRKRDEGKRDDRVKNMTPDEVLALGDDNPNFRYAA